MMPQLPLISSFLIHLIWSYHRINATSLFLLCLLYVLVGSSPTKSLSRTSSSVISTSDKNFPSTSTVLSHHIKHLRHSSISTIELGFNGLHLLVFLRHFVLLTKITFYTPTNEKTLHIHSIKTHQSVIFIG